MKFREVKNNKVTNLAGGVAYSQPPKIELISLLLTSFVEDKFYRKASDELDKLKQLIKDIPDKMFIAKAIVFARKEFGLRSITHAAMIELLPYCKSTPAFYKVVAKAIHRPDDILEMVAYYKKENKGGLPNALRKGINLALADYDEYRLAKYRGEKSTVKMVDVFNLTHPKPKDDAQSELWKRLIKGELKNTETWESKLSKAGQEGETEEQVDALKGQAWKDLLTNNKLGYFALLRNLRNIMDQAPDCIDLACTQLVNEVEIKKSLVLPFRFLTAYDALKTGNITHLNKVKMAIDNAVEISLNNVPKFDGVTLVVVDGSGSMSGKPIQIAALFASAILKANPYSSHMIMFAEGASYASFDPRIPLATLSKLIEQSATHGGTNFNAIFPIAQTRYDRVIILSDMQGWMEGNVPTASYNAYKTKYNADPFIYSFDLQGYGSMQFKSSKVACIAGFSEKIFDVVQVLEQDRNALENKIANYELS
jgi:60 kDa SS-A/Ro ribonucleoprotein